MPGLDLDTIVNVTVAFVIFGLGFGLSEWVAWFKARKAAEEQARNVRAIISLEIDENLSILDEVMRAVSRDLPEHAKNATDEQLARHKARMLINLPEPAWTYKIWESQLPLLAASLSKPEITQAYRFHQKIDTLASIRNQLHVFDQAQTESWQNAARAAGGMVRDLHSASYPFDQNAPLLWKQFSALATTIDTEGNPLRSERPTGVPY